MKPLLWGVALAAGGGLTAPLAAQGTTEDLLRQAHQYYEQLEVERALPLLRQILSPAWPFEVAAAQRVDAYKYLGAALALGGHRDSAVLYFRAALERDAFTDLDPRSFTPAQVTLFAQARGLVFAIGARPVAARRFDPRTERLTVTVATTHAAALTVELRALAAPASAVLFRGTSEGLRELDWNGLLDDGRLAPPGRYVLVTHGTSTLMPTTDSSTVYLDIAHEVEPFEDTLPALGPRDFLPERISPAAATNDLLKGLAVAGATLVIAEGLTNGDLGGGLRAGSRVVAGAAAVTGGVAFALRRSNRDIPENIAANARRRTEHQAANDGVNRRNAERLARTVLVITPAAGVGP